MALTTRLPSARVEPFYGFVETTGDALRLIQAARQGIIPRITRRLNDLERRAMITSGAIFIFSDEESGIKRWTEGLSWSASRIVGNFLVYREVSDRSNARATAEGRRSAKRRGSNNELSAAELAEQKLAKALVGCLSDGSGRFKPNGLVKKTITINVDGSDHHLIAYYNQDDVRLGRLLPLTSRPDIMALDISPELLESTKFRIPPIMHEGPDGRPRYICDAEDGDIPRHIGVPFPSMTKASVFQRSIQYDEAQSHDSSIYVDLLQTNMAVQSGFFQHDRSHISPSPHASLPSNFPDAALGVSETKDARGVSYLPHSIGEPFQPCIMNQSSQMFNSITSVDDFNGCTTLSDFQPIFAPTFLAAQGDLGTHTETVGTTHDPRSRRPNTAVAPSATQTDFMKPVCQWTLPHCAHYLPLTHSSMPMTPIQPRCAQRSTSLPSIYERRGHHTSPPVSHARSGSSPVATGPVIPQADASAHHILTQFAAVA